MELKEIMPTNGTVFFLPRSQRDVQEHVITDFPFPLALTYSRLQEAMDRQDPLAAVWQLRDAFESSIKFAACIAVADLFSAEPDSKESVSLAELLLKPRGLSLGDWHALVEEALKPLASLARDNRLTECRRMFSGLYPCFFKPNGKRTSLNGKIDGGNNTFVNWRNTVFGHGVFKQDRAWYADETLRWIPVLHEFYSAINPVIHDFHLCSRAANGRKFIWQGVQNTTLETPHQHVPSGAPSSMVLHAHDATRELSFGPLLSIQHCAICQQPAVFFFDRNKFEREQDLHKTHFTEYLRGHGSDQKNWKEIRHLASRLPPNFEWQRGSYDALEVEEGLRVVFRDFDADYLRPAYLLDRIWDIVENNPQGYIHLVGDEGVGKSFVVRGLERDGNERNVPVLTYHILPGALSDYRTFISELSDRARDRLRFRTQEAQTKVAKLSELQDEFVEFISELMSANRLETIVIAIDALDELSDPEPTAATISDFLPSPDKLPEGCFIILTSRTTLCAKTSGNLERISRNDNSHARFITIPLQSHDDANQQLLREYLKKHLPEQFNTPAHVEQILNRSGGIFLYADHLCRALDAGVGSDVSELPEGEHFYSYYLARLREQAGDLLYETTYLPVLLFLSAALRPVTSEQLIRWGIPRDRLAFALLDLRDFVRVHRKAQWHHCLSENSDNHYAMAHEAFVRFIREDPELSEHFSKVHGIIAQCAMSVHAGHWNDLDPYDNTELYDLCFVMDHLRAAKHDEEVNTLMADKSFAKTCVSIGSLASANFHYYLAFDLVELALTVCGHTALVFGQSNKNKFVILPLGIKADALFNLGRHDEAIASIDSVITLCRRLISEAGQTDLMLHLACGLSRKAWFQAHTGYPAEALPHNDEAISIARRLAEDSDSEIMPYLAGFLNDKGSTLNNLMLSTEAVAFYDESISIRKHLVDVTGRRPNELQDLGSSLFNRGNALNSLHHFTAAIASFQESESIYRELISAHGQIQLSHYVSRILIAESVALSEIGRFREAVSAAEESVSLIQRLIEVDGRFELAADVADIASCRGSMLASWGHCTEAYASYDEAIGIYRRMIETENRHDLLIRLAYPLTNKAELHVMSGCSAPAISLCDEAIEIRRHLIENEGRQELTKHLAYTLTIKSLALAASGDHQPALSLCDEALGIMRSVSESCAFPESEFILTRALCAKGLLLAELGNTSDSITNINEAIDRVKVLIESEWQVKTADELSECLVKKASISENQGNIEEACSLYAEGITRLNEMVSRDMNHKIVPLCRAAISRCCLLLRSGNTADASKEILAIAKHVKALSKKEPPDSGFNHDRRMLLDELNSVPQEKREAFVASLGKQADLILPQNQ